jgi:hypothetical protein
MALPAPSRSLRPSRVAPHIVIAMVGRTVGRGWCWAVIGWVGPAVPLSVSPAILDATRSKSVGGSSDICLGLPLFSSLIPLVRAAAATHDLGDRKDTMVRLGFAAAIRPAVAGRHD